MLSSIFGSATPCVRPDKHFKHLSAAVASRSSDCHRPRRDIVGLVFLKGNRGFVTPTSCINAASTSRGLDILRSAVIHSPKTSRGICGEGLRPTSNQIRRRTFGETLQLTSTDRYRKLDVSASLSPPTLTGENEKDRPKLAVFVSGGGSNFRAINAAILEGRIRADVALLISDSPGCGGWQYAEQHGIPCLAYPTPGSQAAAFTKEQLVHALRDVHAVDYIVLAGYLKLIPAEVVLAYKRAILNIHPALLPAFGGKGYYGTRVHKAVIASGARYSGATVHFIDEKYDTGPILAQRVVRVFPSDTPGTLAKRVLGQEHQLYPEAVAALVDGRVTWREDGVPVLWTSN